MTARNVRSRAAKAESAPSRELLLEHYDYVPESGIFLRKHTYKHWKAGQEAGSLKRGAVCIRLGSAEFARKLLVWLVETGEYPTAQIVWLNGVKTDDRFYNLLKLPTSKDGMTYEMADKIFSYDPVSGIVRQKVSVKKANAGNTGRIMCNGYISFMLQSEVYLAHRLAWLLTYKEWPNFIDHINGVRTDNRLDNLRSVTRKENARNIAKGKNATGVTGVYLNSRGLPFRARICNEEGLMETLGNFQTLEEAREARKKAEIRLGYHPNHGKTKEERAET